MKVSQSSITSIVDEVAYHRYGGTVPVGSIDATEATSIRTNVESTGQTTSMDEFIGANYLTLDQDLASAHNSSWEQYTITFPYPGENEPTAVVLSRQHVNMDVDDQCAGKIPTALFQIRPAGAVMKGVSNSVSAFKAYRLEMPTEVMWSSSRLRERRHVQLQDYRMELTAGVELRVMGLTLRRVTTPI